MQISGQKELGNNTIASRKTEFLTGVPIKKRKFPFIRPASPPPPTTSVPITEQKEETTLKADSLSPPANPSVSEEEQVTLNAESYATAGSPTASNMTEKSSLKLEISSSSAVSLVKFDGLSSDSNNQSSSLDQNKEKPSKENIEAESDVVSLECSLQKPAIEALLGPECGMCIKSISLGSDDTALQKIEGVTKLQLEPNKDDIEKVNEDMQIEYGPLTSNKCNLSENSVTGARDEPFSDVISQDGAGICEEGKLDPCSWNLALTKRQTGSNDTAEEKFNGTHPQANRDHWDLNTMMDTWEGMNQSLAHEGGKSERHDRMVYRRRCNSQDFLVASSKRTPEVSNDKSRLFSLPAAPEAHTKNDILLRLSLSTSSSLPQGSSSAFFRTSTSLTGLRNDIPSSTNFSKCSSPPNNLSLSGSTIVKSEPDDSSKQDLHDCSLRLMRGVTVKTEPCVTYIQQQPTTSSSRVKLITCGSVKMETVCSQVSTLVEPELRKSESNTDGVLPLSSLALPVTDVLSSTTPLPITSHCPTSLSLSNCVESNHSEILAVSTTMASSGKEAQEITQIHGVVASDLYSDLASIDVSKDVTHDISGDVKEEVSKAGRPDSSRVKSMDKIQLDSHGSNDLVESEEKMNLFDDLQDDCSFDSDEELDGKQVVSVCMDNGDKHHAEEEDDYEDGEVREPLVNITTEIGLGPCTKSEYASHGILDSSEVGVSGCDRDATLTAHCESQVEDPDAMESSQFVAFDDTQKNSKYVGCASGPSLQEVLAVENSTSLEDIIAAPRGILSCMAKEEFLKCYRKDLSDGTVSGSQGISLGDDQGSVVSEHDTDKGSKYEEKKFSGLSKTESLVAGTEATKDGKCNQSRIINLARAFSGTSPSRLRSYSGRFLPSRVERERYNDGVRNGDKLQRRGSRDDGNTDGRSKYERQRNQEQPLRSSGSEYMHGRGRSDKRFDPPHGDWDSDHSFDPKLDNRLTTYRISGPKNAAAVMVSQDCTLVGTGRKNLRDEVPNFRHLPSRRRSPRGRGRPAQMVSRSPRDVSPDRLLIGRDNFIGLRSDKKFIRGLPDDMLDAGFSRRQPQYQQVDDHFVRAERSFSPIQRKGSVHVARIRSRSPSRARSPGSWSSPRRRSPDGFGRGELVHRRSPTFFRVKRLRSSPHQRPVYPDDIDGRRHGSPPYLSRLSNDMRDSRDPDHLRSFVRNRSPSGRVLARGARRFDMIDPRERIEENDDYYAGPMQSDRFHENGGDGGAEGRRLCGDRRRSFRPTYETNEAEKFHFHVDGASRPYRFSPEPDTEFHEGGNLRDREFERRVKNQPGNTPRRTRSVEEQEENYRNSEQPGWESAAFEDASPLKRRRF